MVIPRSSIDLTADVALLQTTASWRRLGVCIRSLGLSRGWRYWRLENRALEDPSFVPQWIGACEKEALRASLTEPTWAKACAEWAALLKKHHFQNHLTT